LDNLYYHDMPRLFKPDLTDDQQGNRNMQLQRSQFDANVG